MTCPALVQDNVRDVPILTTMTCPALVQDNVRSEVELLEVQYGLRDETCANKNDCTSMMTGGLRETIKRMRGKGER